LSAASGRAGVVLRKRFPIALDKLGKPASPRPRADRTHGEGTAPAQAALRQRMVARLQGDGNDVRVLEVMSRVPRHVFVAPGLEAQAYEDLALPIGQEQTISSPSVVARMLSLLLAGRNAQRASSLGRVLEVGTGCGYQAALLSMLGTSTMSIERVRVLHEAARRNLACVEIRRHALRLVLADGRLGHPPNAPYDSIIAAAAGDALPQAWIDQLAVGGRLVMPQQQGSAQVLVVIDRHERGIDRTDHEAVRFVPLESGVVL
jgi:protein-L-isoaspartate(D-aspartate) O-methyltransferase